MSLDDNLGDKDIELIEKDLRERLDSTIKDLYKQRRLDYENLYQPMTI